VLRRVLALSDDEVDAELEALRLAYEDRHRDIEAVWEDDFALVEHRLNQVDDVSVARRRLIGAYFTQEFSLEGAALFNPSMVHHPDQSGLRAGTSRFVMSLRAVGEGHISSIELRTGTIDADDTLVFTPHSGVAAPGTPATFRWSRRALRLQLADMWGDHSDSDYVLSQLPDTFDRRDLDLALQALRAQRVTRVSTRLTIDRIESLADCSYTLEFDPATSEEERVLLPRAPSERQGMEDLRLVRFTGDDDEPRYLGTYTAYDGARVSAQLLTTDDLRRFSVTRLTGPGSKNKGLALFPRRIDGRYLAMSRADRENNALTWSDDLLHWEDPDPVQRPVHHWEIVQLGNCGSPIETEAGWLVLTHGVGPMRQYSVGALLLDLADPRVVIGSLEQPLLEPDPAARSGYVPSVVYSCGGMMHGRTLVLPYGCNDSTTRVALVALDPLLAELTGRG
jgi:predicted GH43/DUF377 family glycosyl hydrolase